MYGGAWSQLKSTFAEGVAVAGENSGPDGVRATVLQSEDGGGNSSSACKFSKSLTTAKYIFELQCNFEIRRNRGDDRKKH